MPLLYKYLSFTENTESAVATPRLWFSRPSKLNDPFELKPWYEFNYQPHQLVEQYSRQLRKANPGMTEHTAVAEATAMFLKGDHRNPTMWESLRNNISVQLDNEIGLLCLSTVNDSILMWSHYCRNHEGICLGFKWSVQTEFFGKAQQVKYRSKLPTVDVYNTPHEKQVEEIFLTKFSDWRYEKEWRIIDHDDGEGLRRYPLTLLKTITFGVNTSALQREQVKQWVKQRGHDVDFFECKRDERTYKLLIQPTQ
jgi:hypothetical protein